MATILRAILTSLHGRQIGLSDAQELIVRGEPDQVTITPAAGATNVSLVTLQAVNNEGIAYNAVLPLLVWLSDVATGNGLTATTVSGAVGAGSKGTDLASLTSKKALSVLTSTDGSYILSITDTGKLAAYVCARLEQGRKVRPVTRLLTTANYGP